MANRIDTTFEALRAEGKKAFISYIVAYDPDREISLKVMKTMADCGVDILELGVPFSDPVADGVVNQEAALRGLNSGASVSGVMDLIREFRKSYDTPIVIFTYLNPLYVRGFDKFQVEAIEAGADAVLMVDLTADEAMLNSEFDRKSPLYEIQIVSPFTPLERKKIIAARAEGFIYMLSRAGVTGLHSGPAQNIVAQIEEMKTCTHLPVCVGFGINTPEQAASIAQVADGVIVGSGIVKIVNEFGKSSELVSKLKDYVCPLVEATHTGHV